MTDQDKTEVSMPGFNANNSSKVKPFLSANCRPPSPLRTVSYIGWSDLEFCICSLESEFCGGCCSDCSKLVEFDYFFQLIVPT